MSALGAGACVLDLCFGLAWMSILVQPTASKRGRARSCCSSCFARCRNIERAGIERALRGFASTLPVTIAVIARFVSKGRCATNPCVMTADAQGYFSLLVYRLYSATLATLQAGAEKDALIGELEASKAISDEARRRAEGAKCRQVALPRTNEPPNCVRRSTPSSAFPK